MRENVMLDRGIDQRPYFEQLDGVEFEKAVSPYRQHGIVQVALATIVNRCGEQFGFTATEVHVRLGEIDGTKTVLLPDIAFWRFDAFAAIKKSERDLPPVAPEVTIEIRSPGEHARLREAKIAKYLSKGGVLVLDVDFKKRTIAAHTKNGMRTYASGERFQEASVPWLVFEVREAFAALDRFDRNTD